jgi:hypothetical protein
MKNMMKRWKCNCHNLTTILLCYAPECHSSPDGYIEGWYVEEAHRKLGIGKELAITEKYLV